jgi:hypothetical protein
MEACKHAFISGMFNGAYYGGVLGLGTSMYTRKLRYVPMYAVGAGVTWGLLLSSSAWFRFDI